MIWSHQALCAPVRVVSPVSFSGERKPGSPVVSPLGCADTAARSPQMDPATTQLPTPNYSSVTTVPRRAQRGDVAGTYPAPNQERAAALALTKRALQCLPRLFDTPVKRYTPRLLVRSER